MTDVAVNVRVPRPRWLMPTEAYISPEWYQRELTVVFGKTWQWVGTTSELPNVGSFFTVTVGHEPVLVTRTSDTTLGAYVNMCRHRGMALACGAGEVDSTFRCPYHAWEFALDGTLARVPQRKSEFGDIDAEELGLVTVDIDTWQGQVFVNTGAEHETLADYLADLPENLPPYPFESLTELYRIDLPVQANWKLVIENHIDILHLWYLHPWLNEHYDNPNYRHAFCGPHWASSEMVRDGVETPPMPFHPIPGLPPAEERTIRANLFFPNTAFNQHGNSTSVFRVVPTGPESCVMHIRFYGTGVDSIDEYVEGIMSLIRDEDGWAAEQMQRTMHSSHWAVGPLAQRWEAPIEWFQTNLLALLDTEV